MTADHMTIDRLAALLHEALCGPFGFHDDPATATCGALAARLAAVAVTAHDREAS